MTKKSIVHIQHLKTSIEERNLLLPETIIKQKKIPTQVPIILQFGSMKKEVSIMDAKQEGLKMNEQLARKMGIPNGCRLCVEYRPMQRTLQLGPLLGVMMSRVYPKSKTRPFGSNTAFCKELYDTYLSNGGLVFFFTPPDISLRRKKLRGWIPNSGWHRSVFPVPNVVYNRLTTRKLENSPRVQRFMKQCKTRFNCKVFNEKFLDKTDVFQALQKDASLHRYLPQSSALTKYATLVSMLKKHKTVFLKPVRGSLGKGIIRISRLKNGSYACQSMSLNGMKTTNYRTLAEVLKAISGKMKARRYQVQQGVQLLHAGKRPIDFRALVQKNEQGKWEITSIVARIAGPNHFVSNLARGGTLSTVRNALQRSNLPAKSVGRVNTQLRTAAIRLARGIETQIPYHFGELGVDLAADQKGRVWLLEINSKPSKNDDTSMPSEKARPSVRKVVQYTHFLTNF